MCIIHVDIKIWFQELNLVLGFNPSPSRNLIQELTWLQPFQDYFFHRGQLWLLPFKTQL